MYLLMREWVWNYAYYTYIRSHADIHVYALMNKTYFRISVIFKTFFLSLNHAEMDLVPYRSR